MKQAWMHTMAHLHAQDAAYFFLFIVGVMLLSGWLSWRHG